MHCDPPKDKAVSSLAMLFIAIQPFLKWCHVIYLLGSLGLLGLTLLQDFASLLTMNYELPFQGQHTCMGGTGHTGPSPVGTRMSVEESR